MGEIKFVNNQKIILVSLAILQVLINFGTNLIVVKKIGFGTSLDIYYISLSIYTFLLSSVGWSISSVLTPILIENRGRNLEGSLFLSLNLIGVLLIIAASVILSFASKLIFSSFPSSDYETIRNVQIIFLLTFLISLLNILFLSILQEKNKYIKINFFNLVSALIGLFFVSLTVEKIGIYAAVLNQLFIQLLLFFFMGAGLYKSIWLSMSFDKQVFNLLWKRARYIFFGSFYYRTDELTERVISSFLVPGFLSLTAFIQRVYGAIITVLNTSISGPTITIFSDLVAQGKSSELKKYIKSYLIYIFLCDTFLFILIILFGESVFLYFFRENVPLSLEPILYLGMITLFVLVYGKTLGQVLHNLLLSLKLERNITICDSASFTLGITLKMILTYLFGVKGFLWAIAVGEVLKITFKGFLAYKSLKSHEMCIMGPSSAPCDL